MAELKSRFGDEAEGAPSFTLIVGDRGVFDVKVEGLLVFSKFETGRFPMLGEVAEAIAEILP